MNTKQQNNQPYTAGQHKLNKNLLLAKETLRELTNIELSNAAGGKPGMLKSHVTNCPFNCADTIGCDPIP